MLGHKKTYLFIAAILLISLILIKIFSRPLYLSDEAVAGYIVVTFVPSINTVMYSMDGVIFEMHTMHKIFQKDDMFRSKVTYPYIKFYKFEDGSIIEEYYYKMIMNNFGKTMLCALIVFMVPYAINILRSRIEI